MHFALRGTHAAAWGDAGSAEASSCWERRLTYVLLSVMCVADGQSQGKAMSGPQPSRLSSAESSSHC